MCVCVCVHYACCRSSKAKAKAKTSERDRSALRSQPQPTIIQSLAGVSKQSAALRKHPSTKTRSSSIDEMFGMGSGWISDDDDEEDNRPPNSVGCSSGSADSPSCSTGSAVTLSYNSASVASVASESGNTALALPEVISSSSGPVSYTTPPLSTVDMCGCDVIESYSAGSQSPNIQSPVTQDIVTHLAVPLSPGLRRGSQDRVTTTQRKSLRLKNLALCKSSGSDPSSVDLQRREAKHRVGSPLTAHLTLSTCPTHYIYTHTRLFHPPHTSPTPHILLSTLLTHSSFTMHIPTYVYPTLPTLPPHLPPHEAGSTHCSQFNQL